MGREWSDAKARCDSDESDRWERIMATGVGEWENLSLPVGRPYLVGVSGGCDSVTLLHLLIDAGHRNLVVCHLDHGLRGEESDGDRCFVQRLAAKLGCSCEVEKMDVAELAKDAGESIQLAARRARHRFFARVAAFKNIPDVILAHHADDQAETIFVNLLRGSGLRGIAGMQSPKAMCVDNVSLVFHRPLLTVRRAAIRNSAALRKIEFREDSSNASRHYLRNRVRHDLLPAASEAADRDVVDAVVRLGTGLRDDVNFLDELVSEASVGARWGDGEDGALSVVALRSLHPSVRVRVLSAWLEANQIGEVSQGLLGRVDALLDEEASVARVNLPGGHWARRRGGKLFVQK